ncbi:MAG: hypothetical protein H8E24_14555 [Verrucomicrobia bacterium]|jgi:hypothetical protein|nr:hypothetical protein [Verrucomicrobiota bacterium]
MKSDMIERVSHISNEQERDALAPKVFNAHYDGLVTDADAKKYWAVMPPSDDGGSDESN